MIHVSLTFGAKNQVTKAAKKKELWPRAQGCEKVKRTKIMYALKRLKILQIKHSN